MVRGRAGWLVGENGQRMQPSTKQLSSDTIRQWIAEMRNGAPCYPEIEKVPALLDIVEALREIVMDRPIKELIEYGW